MTRLLNLHVILSLSFPLLVGRPVLGQTPLGTAFTYQGQLKSGGSPAGPTANLAFSLWDAAGSGSPPVGGNQVGTAISMTNVPLTNGLFTVQLNVSGEFGTGAFNGEARWLQIAVNGTTLSPRQPLTAAPYALRSAAPWATNGANISYSAGEVGIGTTTPGAGLKLDVQQSSGIAVSGTTAGPNDAAVYGRATDPSGGNYGGWFESPSGNGTGVLGKATAGSGGTDGVLGIATGVNGRGVSGYASSTTGATLGAQGISDSTSGIGVRGIATASSGSNYGVYGSTASAGGYGGYFAGRGYFSDSVGIGTTTPSSKLDVQQTFGVGVSGTTAGTNDVGVYGKATDTAGGNAGGLFESPSTNGTGVIGRATASSGTNYGVFGSSASTLGTGERGENTNPTFEGVGVYGTSAGLKATGVFGSATASGPGSATIGVYGSSSATFQGIGVQGDATGSSGFGFGGFFSSRSDSGTGVSGSVTATSGSTIGVSGKSASTAGVGIRGDATASSGTTYGVYGTTASSDLAAAGVRGVVTSTGTTFLTFGVLGENSSPAGVGVRGSGSTGVWGTTSGSGGIGVVGSAKGVSGATTGVAGNSDSTAGTGVRGDAIAFSGTNYGVYGTTSSSAGYGGYFLGRGYFSGNVGIGMPAPAEALDVSGNMRASGSVFASCGTLSCSDARFKTNIEPMSDALGLVQRLRPVHFDWCRDEFPDRKFEDKRQVGLIAQEVEKVLPDVVAQDGEGYYSIDYGRLTPVLVEAVKEQQKQIESTRAETDARVNALEAENDELKARLERLEAMMNSSTEQRTGGAR